MSFLDLDDSIKKAEKKLASIPANPLRRRRSDRGRMRISAPLAAQLQSLLSGLERPSERSIYADLEKFCTKSECRVPARATLYSFMAKAATPSYNPSELPQAVRKALYNLDENVPIPGHQLTFYCFNYGDLPAVSFASGFPWLSLYQAYRMRGFRPKSLGLLEAVLRVRGI